MKIGFVCPKWALDHWNHNECTIERLVNGTFNGYTVLDHSIQTSVYNGKTHKECKDWLDGQSLYSRVDPRDASQVVEQPYPIGICPRQSKGDYISLGKVYALVYTEWLGGECKAFDQVYLLQMGSSMASKLYHPGHADLTDCATCYIVRDHIGLGEATLRIPYAKTILTSDSEPITWDEFTAMVFEKHISKEDGFNPPPDRYSLLDLEKD